MTLTKKKKKKLQIFNHSKVVSQFPEETWEQRKN